MELQEFVAKTLVQIIAGVKDAQAEAKKHGAEVSPHLTGGASELGKHGFIWASGSAAQIVQFDVALTITEGTDTKGGIGVFSGAINLGSSGQSKNENMSVSRIKFSVPLSLPHSVGS